MKEKHFMLIWKNSALCLVAAIPFIWTHTMLHNTPAKSVVSCLNTSICPWSLNQPIGTAFVVKNLKLIRSLRRRDLVLSLDWFFWILFVLTGVTDTKQWAKTKKLRMTGLGELHISHLPKLLTARYRSFWSTWPRPQPIPGSFLSTVAQ